MKKIVTLATLLMLLSSAACREENTGSGKSNSSSIYTYNLEVSYVSPQKRKITGQYWYGVKPGQDLRKGRSAKFSTDTGVIKTKFTTLGPSPISVIANGTRNLKCVLKVSRDGKVIDTVNGRDPAVVHCNWLPK